MASHYEVLVVRHGTRTARRSDVFLNYSQYGLPDGPHTVDYYFWIIRADDKTVLVDTGFASDPALRRGRTILVDAEAGYRELGVDPLLPIDIIVTHAHYDHIGNLALFPHATIVIAQSELDFWTSELATRPLVAHFSEPSEINLLERLHHEGRLRTFSGTLKLLPGIEVIEVGGHTPGQSMVKVDTTEGVVLLTSDAVHFREELTSEMPFVSVTDLLGMYRGFALVNKLLADHDVDIVVPGHDADVLHTIAAYPTTPTSPLLGQVGVVGLRTR